MPELETRYVDSDLGRLRIRTCGEGPPVLLWPNHYLTGLSWRQSVGSLAGRHELVLLDPPGHGGSARLARDVTTAECAAVICEVLDGLALPSARLVGVGWGAQVALVTAAMHRERVDSVVLVNASADPAPHRRTVRARLFQRLYGSFPPARPFLARRLVKRLLGSTSLARRRGVVAQIRYAIRAADPVSVRHAVRDVLHRRADHTILASTVRVPALVIAGAEDRTIPAEEGRRLAGSLPQGRFVVLDGVGHSPQVEAPERLNDLLGRFWDGAEA